MSDTYYMHESLADMPCLLTLINIPHCLAACT